MVDRGIGLRAGASRSGPQQVQRAYRLMYFLTVTEMATAWRNTFTLRSSSGVRLRTGAPICARCRFK